MHGGARWGAQQGVHHTVATGAGSKAGRESLSPFGPAHAHALPYCAVSSCMPLPVQPSLGHTIGEDWRKCTRRIKDCYPYRMQWNAWDVLMWQIAHWCHVAAYLAHWCHVDLQFVSSHVLGWDPTEGHAGLGGSLCLRLHAERSAQIVKSGCTTSTGHRGAASMGTMAMPATCV